MKMRIVIIIFNMLNLRFKKLQTFAISLQTAKFFNNNIMDFYDVV